MTLKDYTSRFHPNTRLSLFKRKLVVRDQYGNVYRAGEVPKTGMAAMGHPVQAERKSAALAAVREMIPGVTTAEATELIDGVSAQLERDEPYEAQRLAMKKLDLTGVYRLLAHLITEPARVEERKELEHVHGPQ